MSEKFEVLLLTPTPNEHKSVKAHLARNDFKNLAITLIECGPGRILATYAVTKQFFTKPPKDLKKFLLMGAGTCGTLALDLVGGDMIVSNSAIISDWRMDDGRSISVSPYGGFDYRSPQEPQISKMVLECDDPLVLKTIDAAVSKGFKVGRLLTSESFMTGKDHKLSLGRTYGCLACEMESGVFGYVANALINVSWLNIRVVADTLDEALSDYLRMERDMTEILGNKAVEILKVLDEIV
ncbi:MAG: hypothetical protein LBT62_03475 [Deltaproteobacteria bacterium]|nr:hypothetical protein [Deltaproteobacteria bacterium]